MKVEVDVRTDGIVKVFVSAYCVHVPSSFMSCRCCLGEDDSIRGHVPQVRVLRHSRDASRPKRS